MYRLLLFVLTFYELRGTPVEAGLRQSPINQKECPEISDLLDYCETKWQMCENEKSTPQFCATQFCHCVKIEHVPPDQTFCSKSLEKRCKHHMEHSKNESANKEKLDWQDNIKTIIETIAKKCKITFSDNRIKNLKTFHEALSSDSCVMNHKKEVDDALISLDESVAILIPFDRFQCGWQFGYMGKILFRSWIGKKCGIYTIEINHCCAEHQSCYIENKDQKTCDENFVECGKRKTSVMKSLKTTCTAFTNQIASEFSDINKGIYEKVQLSELKTVISSFDMNFNKGTAVEDLNNTEFAMIKVFLMNENLKVDPKFRRYFNENVYRHGWSKRVVIDSCEMIFEECLLRDEENTCVQQINVCLNDTEGKSKGFEDVIKDLIKIAESVEAEKPTMSKIDNVVQQKIDSAISTLTMEYLIFTLFFGLLLSAIWKNRKEIIQKCCKCKTDNAQNQVTPKTENNGPHPSEPLLTPPASTADLRNEDL